ncbi:MAG: hypothetical protein CfClM3_0586 [Methanobrevibacter sp. CfCl-M3]
MKIGEIIDKIKEIDVKEIEFKKIHVIGLIVGLVLVFGALPAYNFVMEQTGNGVINTTQNSEPINKINVSKIQIPIGTTGMCNFGVKSSNRGWSIDYMNNLSTSGDSAGYVGTEYYFRSSDIDLYNKLKNASAISITYSYNNVDFGNENFELTKDVEVSYTTTQTINSGGATLIYCSIRDIKILGQ